LLARLAVARRTERAGVADAESPLWALGVELVDLLLEPSQMLLDFSALGLERLYDLLDTRQVLLLTEGDFELRAWTP
jgi:hypothetical protein